LRRLHHVDSIDALSLDGCELTIGSFDGIHVGHRQLIRQMRQSALDENLPTTVLSFFPHPSVVLRGRKPAFYLSSPDEKARLLGELGVDYVINQRFDLELSKLSAATFLDWIEVRLHPRGLWVGPDFALGYQREGDIAYLRSAAETQGFRLHVVEPSQVAGEAVSSTRIRQALRAGDVARANQLLGAPFSLPAPVGDVQPTAPDSPFGVIRLDIPEERACPSEGVYAGRLETGVGRRPALAHVLRSPGSDESSQASQIDLYLPLTTQKADAHTRLAFLERLGPGSSPPLPDNDLDRYFRAGLDSSGQEEPA
jgi:riboflavin kinase/FMN adenylyltransferase